MDLQKSKHPENVLYSVVYTNGAFVHKCLHVDSIFLTFCHKLLHVIETETYLSDFRKHYYKNCCITKQLNYVTL